MMHGRRVVTGVAAIGALTNVAVLTACSGGGASSTEPSGSVGTSVSGTPAITAATAPTPSPAPSGFLPVNSLGASEIPWDEVGPGWFLVAWRGAEPPSVDEFVVGPSPSGFSLVGPDATTYALTDLGIADAAWVIDWRGDEVGVARNPDVAEGDYGDVATINLRTGAENTVVSRGQVPAGHYRAANGDLVGSQFYGDLPVPVFSYRDYRPVGELCDGNGGLQLMSPDGVRVVCLSFLPTDDAKTAVVVGRVDAVGSPEQIDVFQASPYRYSIIGWLNADTFILERLAEADGDPSSFFTYNVATRKIAEYAVPVAYDADLLNQSLSFDATSQTFAISHAGAVAFYSADGTPIADVTCETGGAELAYPGVEHSGTFALVACASAPSYGSEGALVLVDLQSGTSTKIATFDQTVDSHLGDVTRFMGER